MSISSQKKELLLANKGFEKVFEYWIPLVDSFSITSVPSEWRSTCPFCESGDYIVRGQYLYYSNLIRLRECSSCSLVYSDILIDDSYIKEHFEEAYKDDGYFLLERQDIFNELCDIVVRAAPRGAKVLDVGGATGIFATMLREKRPDLDITVSDISSVSCDLARSKGFKVRNQGISDLDVEEKFDVILLLDVLYYEKKLQEALGGIKTCLRDDGMIVYRGPNKYFYIFLESLLQRAKKASHEIASFNPEHIYVLRAGFLSVAFGNQGFSRVEIFPSKVLHGKGLFGRIYGRIINCLSKLFFAITGTVISPSFIMIIRK